MEFDDISKRVIGCALEVHRFLGPGLLESAYEQCLAFELSSHNIKFKRQEPVPVIYKGIKLDCGYKIDLLVEDELIVELKSVSEINHLHEAQILTYMKLTQKQTGLIINFNSQLLKNGIKRFVI